MSNICLKCLQPNETLHWIEQDHLFVCPGCATDRLTEQQRLNAKFRSLNIHQESFDNRIIKTPKSKQ